MDVYREAVRDLSLDGSITEREQTLLESLGKQMQLDGPSMAAVEAEFKA